MKNSEICGFHSRSNTCSICAQPDTQHTSIQSIGLRFHLSSAVMARMSCSLKSFIIKRFLRMSQSVVVGIWVSDLFFITIYLDFARFLRTRSTISSDVLGRPDPFLLHKQPASLNFLCHVQICIAVGDCFENSLANACCTVLFDYDRAYSNT